MILRVNEGSKVMGAMKRQWKFRTIGLDVERMSSYANCGIWDRDMGSK